MCWWFVKKEECVGRCELCSGEEEEEEELDEELDEEERGSCRGKHGPFFLFHKLPFAYFRKRIRFDDLIADPTLMRAISY